MNIGGEVKKLQSEERSFRNYLDERDSENLESRGVKDSVSSHLENIGKFPRLNDHQINILVKRVREQGDINARNQLALHNLGLVIFVAKRYLNQTSPSLGFMDFIQEGNIALLQAAEYYNPKHLNKNGKTAKFSTYAMHGIKQRIQRAIADLRDTVRVPVHKHEERWKIIKAINEFKAEFDHEPDLKEIADMLGIPDAEAHDKLFSMKSAINSMNGNLISLDKKISDGSNEDIDKTIKDTVVDKSRLDPFQFLIAKEELKKSLKEIKMVAKLIKLVSKCFTNRNRLIFEMRYGLNDDFEVKTLDYVSQNFSLTKQRVLQILDKAWHNLKDLGIKQDDLWIRNEIRKIHVLRNLIGAENL